MSSKPSEAQPDPLGNIWITSRTRMVSHARYEFYDLLSHFVLTAYSVMLLGFSVFNPHMASTNIGPYTSEVAIVLSLCVLAASLVVWGLGFGKIAAKHRSCYLELHKLYDAQIENSEKLRHYHEILERFPNHSGFDQERMLFRKIVLTGGEVRNTEGRVSFGKLRTLKYCWSVALRWIAFLLLLLAPIIFMGILYVFG
ncbi:SLATT domain-containing protein [Leisingera sp. McT4-56]|uniref:SLATT domain-containing protein n=1 Tax=Leisingera sp. McT4-56 TaxID=2881255 RepID=UPI001CF8EB30|nr:SLATT domain-containing protein [Leisingera sp. McT4-56]MCB4458539.1 SLATT domain-containing protein [Leisingera sp. McT4-56]